MAVRCFSAGPHLTMANPGNIIGGHKANLNNPNTSEEAKARSKEILEHEYEGGKTDKYSTAGTQGGAHKNPQNVRGGLKAAANNPRVSSETRERLQSKLEKDDIDY